MSISGIQDCNVKLRFYGCFDPCFKIAMHATVLNRTVQINQREKVENDRKIPWHAQDLFNILKSPQSHLFW